MTDTHTFLTRLFRNKPDDLFILVYSIPAKLSRWFTDTDEAADYARSLKTQNVYVGCGLAPDPVYLLGKYQQEAIAAKLREPQTTGEIRCHAGDVRGLPGLWLDIDFVGDGHKKQNLPKDTNEADKLIQALALPPSIIVHSGGGLQLWWLFDDLWVFKSEDDQQRALVMLDRFKRYIQATAAEVGCEVSGSPWAIDSVFDLARIMRIPGTKNVKTDKPRDVRLIQSADFEYTVEQVESFLSDRRVEQVEIIKAKPLAQVAQLDEYRLDPERDVPRRLFMAIYSDPANKKFRQTWDHKRTDLIDSSMSSYDMSLATQAYFAGWEDQQVADLLMAHRREYGADLKHALYYKLTLEKAKAARQDSEPGVRPITSESETPDERAKVFAEISELLGIKITGWQKITVEPSIYFVVLENGDRVGVGSDVLNQRSFNRAIYDACDIALPMLSQAKWTNILNRLGTVKEVIQPDPTERMAGLLDYWLRFYFQERVMFGSIDEAHETKAPYTDAEGKIYFFLEDFKGWLKDRRKGAEGTTHRQYSTALRDLGFNRQTRFVAVDKKGKGTTYSVWVAPADFQ